MAKVDKANEALRLLVRRILSEDEEFKGRGGQGRLAVRIGISAPFLSDFLSEKRGAGREMLLGLQRVAPQDVADIIGLWGSPSEQAPAETPVDPVTEPPPGWMPPVAADVMRQLIRQGHPPELVIPIVQAIPFDHKRPPTHLEIYDAAMVALASAGKPQLVGGPSRDPAARTPEERERAKEKRRARREGDDE